MREKPSSNYIRSLLRYCRDTGHLYWKTRPASHFTSEQRSAEWTAKVWNNKYAGKQAGTEHVHGYIKITIDYVIYPAHVLAFVIMAGRWPKAMIDHRDINGLNNNWNNLREATRSENGRNSLKSPRNTSGYKGVSWSKKIDKWVARISTSSFGYLQLGIFNSAIEASVSYNIAAGYFHGEFART